MSQRTSTPSRFNPSPSRSVRQGAWITGLCLVGAVATWACGSETSSGGAGGTGGDGASSSSSKASSTRASASVTNAASVTATVSQSSTAAGAGCNPPATAPSMGMCVTLTSGSTTGATTAATTAAATTATTASTAEATSASSADATTAASTATSSAASSGSTGTGGGLVECNPVTNEPCAADEACDANNTGGFNCFAPPNDSAVCEECDVMAGPFCQGGATCGDGRCFRFCCTDADCGDVVCITTDQDDQPLFPAAPGLGLCVPPQ